jgi:hypothetical protein
MADRREVDRPIPRTLSAITDREHEVPTPVEPAQRLADRPAGSGRR